MRRIRVAIVGCGDIAETGHVPSVLAHQGFELVALCDTRRERAERLARAAPGAAVTTDYRELLTRADLDAVILALHPEVSVAVATAFLESGKAVLDEKPMAATFADGRRLAERVRETGGVYLIGFVMRYCEAGRTLADAARRIGTPALYRVAIYDERLDRENGEHLARIQQILRNSSAITHEASHVVDYFTLWNGAGYTTASAAALRSDPEFVGSNLWSARLGVADGSVLSIEVGWLLPALPASSVTMAGPRGCCEFDPQTGRGRLLADGVKTSLATAPMRQEWRAQLDAFAEAIARGRASVATAEDGLRALAATIACEVAQREGRVVALSEVLGAPTPAYTANPARSDAAR